MIDKMFPYGIPNEAYLKEANKEMLKRAKMEVSAAEHANLQLMAIHFANVGDLYDDLSKEEREAIPLSLRVALRNLVNSVEVMNDNDDSTQWSE